MGRAVLSIPLEAMALAMDRAIVSEALAALALGAWRLAMAWMTPLPPEAGGTPALALSPVGMRLPMRLVA